MSDNVHAKPTVTIHLHRSFRLPGEPPPASEHLFWKLFREASEHRLSVQAAEDKKLTAQQREGERQLSARAIVLEQVERGEAGFAEARQKLYALGFTDADHDRFMTEFIREFLAFSELSPEQQQARLSPEKEQDLGDCQIRNERERHCLEIAGEVNALASQITKALGSLHERASEGHEEAAKQLLMATCLAVKLLDCLGEERPELLWSTARQMAVLPVLASLDPAWTKRAEARMRELQVGADNLNGRFSAAAYDDVEFFPARAYARAVVDTLAANRRDLEHAQAVSQLFRNHLPGYRVHFASIPAWAQAAVTLPDFTREQADAWYDLGKKMIRAECPEFHLRPEWKRYRARFQDLKRGEIQNRLFDLLKSAMSTVARVDG